MRGTSRSTSRRASPDGCRAGPNRLSQEPDPPTDYGLLDGGRGARSRPDRGGDRVLRRRADRQRGASSWSRRRTAWRTAAGRSRTRSTPASRLASGTKGLTALTVVSLIEQGSLELSTTARTLLGDDLPLHRRRRDGRAPARSPLGDRRLLRRGGRDRRRTRIVLTVPAHAARDDGGIPRRPRRASDEVRPGRALLVLQRRLRRPRAARRACERRPVPRARACSGSASRPGCATRRSCARTSSPAGPRSGTSRSTAVEDERLPPAGARQRRRRHLLDGRGHPLAVEGVLRGEDRLGRVGAGDGAAAERCRDEALRARVLARRARPRSSSSKGWTPACRSARRTTLGATHLHGRLEHERRRVADRAVPGRDASARADGWRTSTVRPYRAADEQGWVRCRALSFLGSAYYDDVRAEEGAVRRAVDRARRARRGTRSSA